MTSRAWLSVLLLAACGAERPTPDAAIVDAPAGSVRVSPLPSALPALSASSAPPAPPGWVSRATPRAEQERIAWELLSGRRPASDVPVESYDPSLRAPPTGDRDLSAPVPQVREMSIEVTPGLPKEVVRRIVRQSFGRLRLCYERALVTDPALDGEIVTSLTIDASGAVSAASHSGGTAHGPSLGPCVASALRAASFPQPERAPVQVKLTHRFSRGGSR